MRSVLIGFEYPLRTLRIIFLPKSYTRGYERIGIDHCEFPRSEAEVDAMFKDYLEKMGTTEEQVPETYRPMIRGMFAKRPFIEGAWMNKYQGRYYLQYACPGAEYHTYADGVYVAEHPLGPFTPARNNPYSYHPGGFMPGAVHGSTMLDAHGNVWHTSTMRISVNHDMERRMGIWPAGFDRDGELFCNQSYGDWLICVETGCKNDPWRKPDWYLLSYAKPVSASSYVQGREPALAIN